MEIVSPGEHMSGLVLVPSVAGVALSAATAAAWSTIRRRRPATAAAAAGVTTSATTGITATAASGITTGTEEIMREMLDYSGLGKEFDKKRIKKRWRINKKLNVEFLDLDETNEKCVF